VKWIHINVTAVRHGS